VRSGTKTCPREYFFYPSKNYSFIYTRPPENSKARILRTIITRSEMGQQTAQAKKVSVDLIVHKNDKKLLE